MNKALTAAAEQAHAVDAAVRPRDRGFFETQDRPKVNTDLLVAAQLMGRPLGGNSRIHFPPALLALSFHSCSFDY
jgi:hypothetical protein